MSLEEIVDLTIVVSTTTLTRPGFGTPLALIGQVPAGWGSAKVREFAKLAELTDLGFTSSDPGYKLAQKITSQNPRPKTFKFAKRAVAASQTITLKCLEATEGKVYSLDVGVGNGAVTAIEYTVLAAATTTTVATAIELLIEAVTGVSSSSATDTITITPATAGTLVNVKNWNTKGREHFTLTDTTADPGVEDDLDDALDEDANWYGILLDSNSEAQIAAAAAWTEANQKLFIASTSDSGVADVAVTTDVCSDLKAMAYKRTAVIFNQNDLLSYAAAAWMSRGFAFDPGKITWAFKSLSAIAVDRLKTGQRSTLKLKNCNFYESIAGLPITRWGKVASGEYIDITHGLDWLDAEMRLQVLASIAGLPKLPYTKSGLNVIEGTVKGVLKAGVRQGLLDADGLFVTMPALEDIDSITKSERLVPDIEFGGRLAGAIHATRLLGTLTN